MYSQWFCRLFFKVKFSLQIKSHLQQLELCSLNLDLSIIDQLAVLRERQLTYGELKQIFEPKEQSSDLSLILRQIKIDCLTSQIDYEYLQQFTYNQINNYLQTHKIENDYEKDPDLTQDLHKIINTADTSIQQAKKAFKPMDNIESLELLDQLQQQKDAEINQNLEAAKEVQKRYNKEMYDQAYNQTINNILEYEVKHGDSYYPPRQQYAQQPQQQLQQQPEQQEQHTAQQQDEQTISQSQQKPEVDLSIIQASKQTNEIQSPKIIKAQREQQANIGTFVVSKPYQQLTSSYTQTSRNTSQQQSTQLYQHPSYQHPSYQQHPQQQPQQQQQQRPRQIIQLHKMHNYVQDKQYKQEKKSFQRANQYFQQFEL